MLTPNSEHTAILTERPRTAVVKPQRVLACVLCQQRKVKCDRKFPCQNCTRAGVQCVPTAAPRQRRRRFPERELLDRLAYYEDLLRKNNIKFETLHGSITAGVSSKVDGKNDDFPKDAHRQAVESNKLSDGPTRGESKAAYGAKNLWHAMSQKSRDPEEDDDNYDNDDDSSDSLPDTVVPQDFQKAWDAWDSQDHLLFGLAKANINLSFLHPEQVQIFRLWQIYLENINPLLKVTHTPTLQTRIIDAVGDTENVSPPTQALLFSIYCVAIHSLDDEKCLALFGSPKKDLLMDYRSSCQQALLQCKFLRSGDRDCLTALYLYLVSVHPELDARSLSSMLGAAIRIAQRMGIHDESANAKCTAFEAEMRRRLWWSLVIFDTRISEKTNHKDVTLAPTWNCKTPLNVNDFDLQPEMKTPPTVHTEPTEALFLVVRSEMCDFQRYSSSHLDFSNAILKSITRDIHNRVLEGDDWATLEKMIEEKYLKLCNEENPLHFTTMWTARGYIAKNKLMEYYSKFSGSSVQPTDAQRDVAISLAQRMVQCDTKPLASPITKAYRWWLMGLQFPFPAYLHIVQHLRRRPVGEHTVKCWEVLSDNFEFRFMQIRDKDGHFFKVFARMILQAWTAREAVSGELGEPEATPRIVSQVKARVAQLTQDAQKSDSQQLECSMNMNIDDFLAPLPMDFLGDGPMPAFGGQMAPDSGFGAFSDMSGQSAMCFNMNQPDWTMMDWNPMYRRG